MTARQSFKTAAARRRLDPLIFDLEDTPVPGEVSTFAIDPNLDITTFGSLFAEFSVGAKVLPTDEAGVPTVSEEEVAAYMADLMERAKTGQDALEQCVAPADRERFATVKREVDLSTLVGIVNWLSRELTGRHPTLPGSSSAGSSTTGPSSTGGAEPAALMPPPSPLPAP